MATAIAMLRAGARLAIAAIGLCLPVCPASADPIVEISKEDAERIAKLIKPGDTLLYWSNCWNCSPMLTARKVVSTQVQSPKDAPGSNGSDRRQYKHRVCAAQELFFAAGTTYIDKEKREISAPGLCMTPTIHNACYAVEEDGIPEAGSCTEELELNAVYILRNGAWHNLATIVQNANSPQSITKDTFSLDPDTFTMIEKCLRAYQ